jgi:DNA-binding CsgD family transcriptional regulator
VVTPRPERCRRPQRCNYSIDVKAECALVQCPTLVFHARDDQMVTLDQGRKIAAWIPGARFIQLDSDSHVLPVRHDAGAQMLTLVAQGMTDKQVAHELGLSPRTVEMHVALALRALSCANRAEAVHRAEKEGLLSDDP